VTPRRVVALSGGVGGAKLCHGLDQVLPAGSLSIIVNTGDDLVHWGLFVAPDLDTVMYTLAEVSDDERGWGLRGESWQALAAMKRYGESDWFGLGDRDLATHLCRTAALARGETLTSITDRLRRALGVKSELVPMADDPAPTLIDTVDEGTLPFQDWLVRRRAEPRVSRVRFGARPAPSPRALEVLAEADLVVIGPSNPFVSIEPILALPGVTEALSGKPLMAVSPIVGGVAIKGPLATMLRDLAGEEPSARSRSTVMRSRDDRVRLAREVLAFAEAELP
jgi:LPPG:FO 2-phospho-L-lactate transferase